eukprot:TRINITY_DN955_c0_g2_i1.p1 TRINITY_DN955_c0_g2~~TRINITY_DN955_c0_g2_i1.p1  ORF type:complete len:244 (-),score=47.68 TRINITY_DN955_c0_g2_i1:94-825(-)
MTTPKKDHVYLYQFPKDCGLPSPSPFCLKVEILLRLLKLPYNPVELSDPRKAPKGKLPYIELNGETLSDSTVIFERLQQHFGKNLDDSLTTAQKAVRLSFQRLIEDHLYWIMKYSWTTDEGWPGWQVFLPKFPMMVGGFVKSMIRKEAISSCELQGIAKAPINVIWEKGKKDLDALSNYLGQKKYFFGDNPSSLDCSLLGLLLCILYLPIPSPIKDYASGIENLNNYVSSMMNDLFPDFWPLK